MLNEFQRRFGAIQVNLAQADNRAFVQAYLDSQPNHFNQDFRETLYRHSGGNALFTVEMLHAMQVHGEVVQDKTGHWVQGSSIDWELLPTRVVAVIAERLGRLDRECLTLLKAASMQGEVFIAEVLARVLRVTDEEIIARLSGPLCKQHLLVSPLTLAEKAADCRARYQFRCLLVQKYLDQSLDDVERWHLQRVTKEALETVYSRQLADAQEIRYM